MIYPVDNVIPFSNNRGLNCWLPDLVKYHIGVFMYKYRNQLLPSDFNSFFTKVDQVLSYNTRHVSKLSYYLPKVRTNYGKFNIRFQGPMIWNSINKDFKSSSHSSFKLNLKEHLIALFTVSFPHLHYNKI